MHSKIAACENLDNSGSTLDSKEVDTMEYNDEGLVKRWDIHTDRMVAAAKTGIGAVTVLNSASWIALLSQATELSNAASDLAALKTAFSMWGAGAFAGTLCWLFVYWSASAQFRHDMNKASWIYRTELRTSFWLGLLTAVAALLFFAFGVLALRDILG